MATNINNIRCGMVNVESASGKRDEINESIIKNNFDLFCISETWLKEYGDEAIIKAMLPASYTMVNEMRSESLGGGVGIIVHKKFRYKQIKDKGNFSTFEYIEIKINTDTGLLTVINVYRPPKSNVNEFLREFRNFINLIDNDMKEVVICGDFNLKLNKVSNAVEEFKNILNENSLKNYLNVESSRSQNILQLLISSNERNNIDNIEVEPERFYTSFHKLVKFTINKPTKKKYIKQITVRNKRNFDPEVFIQNCYDEIKIKWLEPCECEIDKINIEGKCIHCKNEIYNKIIKENYDLSCPLTTKQIVVVDNAPWFTTEIKELRKERRAAERKWRRNKTQENRDEYICKSNIVTECIKQTKRNYYNTATKTENDPKKLHRLFDSLLCDKQEIILPEGDTELANDFANYFENKIIQIHQNLEVERNSDDWENYNETNNEELHELLDEFKVSSLEDTIKLIKKAKKTVSDGDPMPISDICHAPNFHKICELIHEIVSDSINLSVVPKSEKIASILPTYKGKGDVDQLNSYRPISNLTFISKIIELTIKKQVCEYIENQNVLPNEQSAYRENYSTETTMLAMSNDFLSSLDRKKQGMLILLDLSAAFDTVDHDILMRLLTKVGFRDNALKWIKSYLYDRLMYVKVKQNRSTFRFLRWGVPQGSVLGPILFSLYISELASILHRHNVKFKFYADDCQIYIEFDNIDNLKVKINELMLDVKRWMVKRWLKLNDDKTVYMYIGNKDDLKDLPDMLNIGQYQIKTTNKAKDLGVIIDDHFKLDNQIREVVRICNYQLRRLATIKKYLYKESRVKLIHNYVINRLDYCNSLYSGLSKSTLRPLQLIMNKAARVVLDIKKRERITPALINLHWLPIKARIEFKSCLLIYKALMLEKPSYIYDLLKLVNHQPTRNIEVRETLRLVEPRFNTVTYDTRSFEITAPRLF